MKYIKVSRYEKVKKTHPLSFGPPLEWEVDNLIGWHIQPPDQILNAIDGEFDCENEIGTKIVLEVVEMTEDEYKKLPEFQGY